MTTPYRVTAEFWDHATLWTDDERDAGHTTDGGRVFGITRTRYVECDGYGCKPVVVIDAEDAGQIQRLWDIYCDVLNSPSGPGGRSPGGRDSIGIALREFANPTTPKPDEPTGLGAVVEDGAGNRWVRHEPDKGRSISHAWYPAGFVGSNYVRARYDDLAIIKVLSEGVTP